MDCRHNIPKGPSPYPGEIRNTVRGTGWWLRCMNCLHDYPLVSAINVSAADCCARPHLHVWSNDPMDPTQA